VRPAAVLGAGALAIAGALGACSSGSGGGASATPPAFDCTPNAAGVDEGADFAASVDAYCMVRIADGAVVPNPAATPYDVNTPLFSDYATKYRTVWLPPGTSVAYSADGRFEFPVGTVITKSFGFPANMANQGTAAPIRWLETRVLIRSTTGWVGTSYVWDDAQKTTAPSVGGDIVTFSFVDANGATQTPSYLIPSQAQCKKCHANDGAMITLGPGAAQLNRDFAYGPNDGGVENELAHWSRVGLLTGAPAPDAAPRLPVFDDPSTGDTAARARAYLQANCDYCHNGNGEARTTGLVLANDETDPYALGLCKPPVAAGKAAANQHYDIVPGQPDASILLYRMQSTAPSIMMPELGRSLEHVEAAQLVSDWIAGLTGSCGESVDAGADAGTPADAGASTDAGAPTDAGVPTDALPVGAAEVP
jgi:uncharacterized repeat protein (TIGR03806 family)